jgi:hypothetical protein
MIPRRPGDRLKTNRCNALALAQLHRAGDLTPVWLPDDGYEAIRDLVARAAAVETVRAHAIAREPVGFMWSVAREAQIT